VKPLKPTRWAGHGGGANVLRYYSLGDEESGRGRKTA